MNDVRSNNSVIRLIEPRYGFSKDGAIKAPSIREFFGQLILYLNPLSRERNLVAVIILGYHMFTFPFVIILILRHHPMEILFFLSSTIIMAHVYNTVWYHRYCSHYSFRFRDIKFSRLFLWSDPLFFNEEIYAIPHFVHHQVTEKAGDPYGPHLGWLGSYFATEITSRIDTKITADEYLRLIHRISHIAIKPKSYVEFQKTGTIERLNHFILRKIVGQFFWLSLSYLVGGIPFLYAWLAGSFVTTAIIRDFNWRGHGGNFRNNKIEGWEFHKNSRALNQHFYGYLASEWHDNHHHFPGSANNGFLSGQFDLAFQIIKVMKCLGLVSLYYDFKKVFEIDHDHQSYENVRMSD